MADDRWKRGDDEPGRRPSSPLADADLPRPMAMAPRAEDPGRYQGPSRAAPYALSRMAPSFDLVNAAEEIQKADATLATVTGGKLGVIAEQIRALQQKAQRLLERARRDAELHRARCSFEKRPGGVYHLYRRDADGELWFSLLAPDEWSRPQPQAYEGSYRLEVDMSFSRVDVPDEDAPPPDVDVRGLLSRG